MNFFGIDIGCTSIKHGLVSLDEEGARVTGFDMLFVAEPTKTENYFGAMEYLIEKSSPAEVIGFGFPSIVKGDWILDLGIKHNEIWAKARRALQNRQKTGYALNDADAAGVAELYRREAGQLRKGVTIVLTLGTGIGSAIFLDGKLLPNSELGLVEMHGKTAEKYAAPSIKTAENLSVAEWAGRLQEFLSLVELVFTPDHLLLGGGISADFETYKSLLQTRTKLLPAFYRNQAGVIGAAMYAAHEAGRFTIGN